MYKIVRLLQEPSPEAMTGRLRPGDAVFHGGLVLPRGVAFEATVLRCEQLWNVFRSREQGGGFLGSFDKPPFLTPVGAEVVQTTRLNLATDVGDVDLMLVGYSRQRMNSLILRHDLYSTRFKFLAGYIGVVRGGLPVQQVYYWEWSVA